MAEPAQFDLKTPTTVSPLPDSDDSDEWLSACHSADASVEDSQPTPILGWLKSLYVSGVTDTRETDATDLQLARTRQDYADVYLRQPASAFDRHSPDVSFQRLSPFVEVG